jgi:hypothetical protein
VDRAALGSGTVDQATGTPTVFRIVFKYLSTDDGLEYCVECDFFLNHLLVAVLRDPYVLRSGLATKYL